ncbi:MAG: glycosyltransferase [Paludibacteraceae bacterium]
MDVEIVSVHYKTPDYIYEQYSSVRKLYPDFDYRIIDGSDDGEVYFLDLEKNDSKFKVERLGYNIHHGPGMDYAIKNSSHDFLLILDSDVTLKKEVLSQMVEKYTGYAVGRKRMVNALGMQKGEIPWIGKFFPKSFKYVYIQPLCMLINKEAYMHYKPFFKHGSPCIDAMIDIYKKKQVHLLAEFLVDDFLGIKYQGTAKKWGMNIPKWLYLVPRT